MSYRDIERSLGAWALTVAGVAGSGTSTPSNLGDRLPFVRIGKVGGSDDGVTDNPLVDIDVFAATRDQAVQIAETIRDDLRPRVRVGGAIIDSVRTNTSPRMLPWDNTNIKRCSATYSLGLRR